LIFTCNNEQRAATGRDSELLPAETASCYRQRQRAATGRDSELLPAETASCYRRRQRAATGGDSELLPAETAAAAAAAATRAPSRYAMPRDANQRLRNPSSE